VKKIAIFVIFLLIVGVVFGQEFTFRGLPWGSTVEEIITKNGDPSSISPMSHSVDGKTLTVFYNNIYVAGFRVILGYHITEKEGWHSSSYIIESWQIDKDNFHDIFNKVEGYLLTLYGTPIRNTIQRETVATQESLWNKYGTMIRLSMITFVRGSFNITITYLAPFSPQNKFSGL